ncbi:MAG: ABC transporter ATP-binding protein [Lachnospiraceae bacterium]|nr:ABC transporter ATP-binding protein [Lachnospiraceae bacterium]
MNAETGEVLRLTGLVKRYGEKKVVDGIGFSVKKGEIVGFIGPNGAGKSTTLQMVTDIVRKDAGMIFCMGEDVESDKRKFKGMLGVVPQDMAVYEDLSAYDNVKFFCSLYGYKGKELKERSERALAFTGLLEWKKEMPSKFSGGMKRRLNIACSIAHSPKILIMDEPTVGIDPQSRNHIMETIKRLNEEGTTVIYVSHYMEEIEAICDRIILADHGRILEDMGKEELKEKYSKEGLVCLEDIFLKLTGTDLRDEEA